MAGNIRFRLRDDQIEVKNFRRSPKLVKFIMRYVDEPTNGVATFDLPTAKRIAGKLEEVKSKHAKSLAAVITDAKKKVKAAKKSAVPVTPLDTRGEYLTCGCVVTYRFPEIRCLEHDLYFARLVEIDDQGWGRIRDLWYLCFYDDGGYLFTPAVNATLERVRLSNVKLVEGTVDELRALITGVKIADKSAKVREAVVQSKLTRTRRKKKKPAVTSLGLTPPVLND